MATEQVFSVVAQQPISVDNGSPGQEVLVAATVAEAQAALGVALPADNILVGDAAGESVALAAPAESSTLTYNASGTEGERIEWVTGLPVVQQTLTYTNGAAATLPGTVGTGYFFSGRVASHADPTNFWFGQISVYPDDAGSVQSVVNGYINGTSIQPFITFAGGTITVEFATPGDPPTAVPVDGTLKYQTI